MPLVKQTKATLTKGRKMKKVEKKQDVKITPVVGDSVLVTFVSDGNGKSNRCKESVDTISAVYLDGSIRIGYNDVYEIEACSNGKAKFQTRFPKKG